MVNKNNYLSFEVLAAGGFSILSCLVYLMFVDKSVPINTVAHFSFAAAFLINFPHFFSSYIMLYYDYRKSILKKVSYFFSAIILPTILFLSFFYIIKKENTMFMGYAIKSMYLLVGWHYFKQIYGLIIVNSVQNKIFYTNFEKKLIWLSLFFVWVLSFVLSNVGTYQFEFYGIKYTSLGLPTWLKPLSYGLLFISFLATFVSQVTKYINHNIIPTPLAVTAFVTMYAWHLPQVSHPGYVYMVPFFHSLQYLTFVYVLKKNQFKDETSMATGSNKRKKLIFKISTFLLSTITLGALFFEIIPTALDQLKLIQNPEFGKSPFIVTFILFINIHHYFIDSTIWRSDNVAVKKYLFAQKGKSDVIGVSSNLAS